jgi:putative ABC transport system permease protein
MFLQDLRYAVRSLAKSPGFSAVAILCLAIGIGVNSTIFSVVDGVLLQPYPYPAADRIVVVNSTNQRLGVRRGGISYRDFRDLQEQTSSFASLAAFTGRSLTIADGGSEPERYSGSTVSWKLFELLGTPPAIGRNFGPEDDRPGAEPVVMLSDEVWQRRFNGDPGIVGRAISVNSVPHTVIGVMPPRFAFPETERLWVPLARYGEKTGRSERNLQVFGRLAPGTSPDQAASDLAGVASRLAQTYPKENRDWSAAVRPLKDWMLPQDVKLIILTMMGAATLVLLIACANVANLMLARASVRHREIAVRAALGAGRWRIVRQLLTEAVTLGFASAPLGVLTAWTGIRLLDRAIPPDTIPYFIHWSLDTRSLLYTIAIAMLTGIVFGLAPSVQAAAGNLQESLKEGGRGAAGGRRAWLRNILVVAEVSLALVLLVGASLFVRSFLNLRGAAVGFDTAPLMTMRFYLPGEAYESPEAKARRVDDIVRRVEQLPGVQTAFASNFVPLSGGGGGGEVLVEGKPVEPGKEPSIAFVAATPHLRQTLGIALVRGRDLTETEETTRTAVALINQSMAKRVWGTDDPIGRRFRLTGDDTPDWFTVVGVVADFRHFQGEDSDTSVFPAAYVPYSFDPTLNTGLTIRVAGDPASITGAVRDQIRKADPTLPVFQVRTMEEARQLSFWQFRLFGWMFSIFGAVALALASIGVYGVLSYSVSQRRQEIGVRVALGASRRDVIRLIVGQGLKLAAAGIVIGAGGAFVVTPVIRTLLYNVTPTDPLSFGGVSAFLVLVALAASYVPARRALGVDPIVALRNE